jgi:hypothetical protein
MDFSAAEPCAVHCFADTSLHDALTLPLLQTVMICAEMEWTEAIRDLNLLNNWIWRGNQHLAYI